MNALEKAKELIQNGKTVPKRTLFTAYIDFHMQHPSVHPDDHLRDDNYNPYTGWQVVLVHDALKHTISEDLHYPCAFLKVLDVLEDLDDQLKQEFERTKQDLDQQIWSFVGDAKGFFDDMDSGSLHMGYEPLQKLYLRMSDENLTAEEEEDTAAGILRTCADVLLWIAQQPNE